MVFNSSQPPLEMLMKTAKLLDVDLNALVRFEELEQKQDLKSNMD